MAWVRQDLQTQHAGNQAPGIDRELGVGQGPVCHPQKRRYLDQSHCCVEVQPTSNSSINSLAVTASPRVGDLALQRRTDPELEEHLKEAETPGKFVGTAESGPDRL